MSKPKLKKIRVRLRDINVCTRGPHYAEWRVHGVFQKWLSRDELNKISEYQRSGRPYKIKLLRKI
jgi:hypothetical protein